MSPGQPLHTPDLVLEPLCEAHAAAMWPLLRDPALYAHLDEAPPSSPQALAQRYHRWATQGQSADGCERWLNWVLSRQGQAVGWAQATVMVQTGSARVAYVLGTAHQGQGLVRQAMRAVLDHLREAHACTTALAQVEAANARSIALLHALGFAPAAPQVAAVHALTATERLYTKPLTPGA